MGLRGRHGDGAFYLPKRVWWLPVTKKLIGEMGGGSMVGTPSGTAAIAWSQGVGWQNA